MLRLYQVYCSGSASPIETLFEGHQAAGLSYSAAADVTEMLP